jgi:hypothetical protein
MCQPGSFSSAAEAPHEKCPLGTFQPQQGASSCTVCGTGTITVSQGTILPSDCISIIFNYLTAFVVSLIVIPFSMHFLYRERFRRIDFFRYARVLRTLTTDTHNIIAYMSYINYKKHAEKFISPTLRRLKTWLFIITSVDALIVGAAVSVLADLGEVFFKTLVLLKSMGYGILNVGLVLKFFLIDVSRRIGAGSLTFWFQGSSAYRDFPHIWISRVFKNRFERAERDMQR